MSVQVTGVANALDNLNREINQIEGAAYRGLHAGALIIQRNAQKLTPVLTGNLKASAFTRRLNFGVEVGFTAAYALAVHENLQAYHKNGEAKFLEKAVSRNHNTVIDEIRKRARV